MNQQLYACMEACNLCADACDYCASACLHEPEIKMMSRCITLDMDSAQLCRVTASWLARTSENSAFICGLCADICEMCAEECERHDMEHCRQCAEACRRCAQECRRIADIGIGMAPPQWAQGMSSAAH